MKASILDCLAAAYRFDLDGAAYVQNLAETAAPLLDRGLGVMSYTYDANDPTKPVIDHFAVSKRFNPEWLPPFYAAVEASGADRGSPEHPTGFASWSHLTVGLASAVPGMRDVLPAFRHIGGSRDALAMNALDASGKGLWLGAPLPRVGTLSPERYELFSRFAAHLTAAFRMRREAVAQKPAAAAVLSPSGQLLDAGKDDAAAESRDDLRRATLAFDQARSKLRRDDELATRRWRPLVTSRWSLIDDFDTDGKRFVVAVENAPPTRGPQRELSQREHQVMTQAHLGHSNKVIAYELGLSHSTVRVLMHRAMHKLDTSSRREAVARFDALVKAGQKKPR
ncbi:MAG: helix-turn-helix transcriptional regulator [Myxococcaceae bacterium]|nr:helix-turn-helix transcriptional regulator [Myxococcaceae bacterium]